MRRPMLLAALLAVPGLALAQVPETQTKSQSKTKPSAAPVEEEPGSERSKRVQNFAAAVMAGEEPPVTGEDGRDALEFILAAYRSGERHEPVTLPLAE